MIRAYVSDHFPLGVSVAIVAEDRGDAANPPSRRIMRLRDGRVHELAEVKPMTAAEPTFVLDDDAARALLDALTRYYHGAEDTRALRKDYDAERARSDKLTGALIGLAQALAGRGAP